MSDEPGGSLGPEKETPGGSDLPGVAAFAMMGTTIASCVAVGVLLGLWADDEWDSRACGSVNRDSVRNGRRRGERCEASPAFPLETHCSCSKTCPTDTLPRLLRRTTLSAIIVGFVGFLVAIFCRAAARGAWTRHWRRTRHSEPAFP